jgi:hypothetical protein
MRSVLSRLLPPARSPSDWPIPIGTKSPKIASSELCVRSRPSIRTHSAVRPSPGGPGSSSIIRPFAMRISMESAMVPRWWAMSSRGGQSSGPGTLGISDHDPWNGTSGRLPSAALTVRISLPFTRPTARAWLTWWPRTLSSMVMSRLLSGGANSRNWAAAQTA